MWWVHAALLCSSDRNVLTVTVRMAKFYPAEACSGSLSQILMDGERCCWSEVIPVGFGAYLRDAFMTSWFGGLSRDSTHLIFKKIGGIHSFLSLDVYKYPPGALAQNILVFPCFEPPWSKRDGYSTGSCTAEREFCNTCRPRWSMSRGWRPKGSFLNWFSFLLPCIFPGST